MFAIYLQHSLSNLIIMPPSFGLSAYKRYEIIDSCLRRSDRQWTKQQLLQYLSNNSGNKLSEAMLRVDIEHMRAHFKAPIQEAKKGRSNVYFYDDPDFSIKSLPLAPSDIRLLKEASILLQQLQGFTVTTEMAAIVNRLEQRAQTGDEKKPAFIAFENLPIASGAHLLQDFYDSIEHQTPLAIQYHPFTDPGPSERIFHPAFLKEFNNRWFVLGFDETLQRTITLALDRVKSMRPAKKTDYRTDPAFHAQTWFEDLIGVTRPEQSAPQTIRLRVKAARAPYLLTKPLHHSQQLLKTYANSDVLLSLHLILNQELTALLLGFGADLEVKEPETLRNQIGNLLKAAAKQYP